MIQATPITTDVLVIGGGIAGCFATLAAHKEGAKVLLVDKGYVSSTGQSPFAGTFLYFDPEKNNKEEWLGAIRRFGDYLVNLDFAELVLDHSKGCAEDLLSYGVDFRRTPTGEINISPPQANNPCRAVNPKLFSTMPKLRKAILDAGATIMDRVMMVDLLVEDGAVCGAVGITVSDAQPVVIHAKRVIIATGGSALKPPSWPVAGLTGDGDMMAYRKGVPITGKEFVDTHPTVSENPNYMAKNNLVRTRAEALAEANPATIPAAVPVKFRPMENGLGNPFPMAPNLNLGAEFEIHAGRGPIQSYGGGGPIPAGEIVNCASSGMGCHKTEGLWAEGTDCSTALKGLYAAGDCQGAMLSGAAYATVGYALAGSAVTGKLAGQSAGKGVADLPQVMAQQAQIDEAFETIYAPSKRESGFSPRWVIEYLQNLMMPYFIMTIKKEDRLLSALTQVQFCKSHIVPKIRSKDAHDLRLAIEVKNMVANNELRLLASLARKESRGTHYREDYPDRNESDFDAWLTIRQVDGAPVVETHKMPTDWAWKEGEARLVQFPTNFD